MMMIFCTKSVTKECLTTVKQVFFHYQEGSLVDHRAYKPYTLVEPPALQLILDLLAVKFLDSRLYITNSLICK